MTHRCNDGTDGRNVAAFQGFGFQNTDCRRPFYLLTVLTAASSPRFFVHGRLSVAGGLIVVLAMIAVTLLFCDILSPLNRRLSLLAASFNLVGLAFEVLRLQPWGANIAVVFNGFFCILIGCFGFRSSISCLESWAGSLVLAWVRVAHPFCRRRSPTICLPTIWPSAS